MTTSLREIYESVPYLSIKYDSYFLAYETLLRKYVDREVTVEDHLLDGGMGSWMLESLTRKTELLSRLRHVCLNSDVCGMVASQSTLNAAGGLSGPNL